MSATKGTGRLGRGGGAKGRGIGGISGIVACKCPQCGYSQPHQRGVPCTSLSCPQCGTRMRGERCG